MTIRVQAIYISFRAKGRPTEALLNGSVERKTRKIVLYQLRL